MNVCVCVLHWLCCRNFLNVAKKEHRYMIYTQTISHPSPLPKMTVDTELLDTTWPQGNAGEVCHVTIYRIYHHRHLCSFRVVRITAVKTRYITMLSYTKWRTTTKQKLYKNHIKLNTHIVLFCCPVFYWIVEFTSENYYLWFCVSLLYK